MSASAVIEPLPTDQAMVVGRQRTGPGPAGAKPDGAAWLGGRAGGRHLYSPALRRARNAAALTRFWQVVEQNRRVPLREVST